MSDSGTQKNLRHSSTHQTLYKRIDNPQSQRISSGHATAHRPSHAQTASAQLPISANPKRVAFKLPADQGHPTSTNKLKAIFYSNPRRPSRNNSQAVSLKTIRSLESSFVKGDEEKGSRRSMKTINPELEECKKISQEILKKLEVFDDSNFCRKQVTGWLENYFEQERSVLARIFLKPMKKQSPGSRRRPDAELQTDIDVLNSKIEAKQKDSFLCSYRFVSVGELFLFCEFIENLYLQKSKIKMKEIETCLTANATQLCQHLKQEPHKDKLFKVRNKPVEISELMQDLLSFENRLGPLKRVATINRNRFKLLNETDLAVNAHLSRLNEEERRRQEAERQDEVWELAG